MSQQAFEIIFKYKFFINQSLSFNSSAIQSIARGRASRYVSLRPMLFKNDPTEIYHQKDYFFKKQTEFNSIFTLVSVLVYQF